MLDLERVNKWKVLCPPCVSQTTLFQVSEEQQLESGDPLGVQWGQQTCNGQSSPTATWASRALRKAVNCESLVPVPFGNLRSFNIWKYEASELYPISLVNLEDSFLWLRDRVKCTHPLRGLLLPLTVCCPSYVPLDGTYCILPNSIVTVTLSYFPIRSQAPRGRDSPHSSCVSALSTMSDTWNVLNKCLRNRKSVE